MRSAVLLMLLSLLAFSYPRISADGVNGLLVTSFSMNGAGSSVTAAPGSTVSANLGYQVWSLENPVEFDQVIVYYSWNSVPPSTYYCAYSAQPGLSPGYSGTASFTFTAPSTPGTYSVYVARGSDNSCGAAASGVTITGANGFIIGSISVPSTQTVTVTSTMTRPTTVTTTQTVTQTVTSNVAQPTTVTTTITSASTTRATQTTTQTVTTNLAQPTTVTSTRTVTTNLGNNTVTSTLTITSTTIHTTTHSATQPFNLNLTTSTPTTTTVTSTITATQPATSTYTATLTVTKTNVSTSTTTSTTTQPTTLTSITTATATSLENATEPAIYTWAVGASALAAIFAVVILRKKNI